MSITQNDILFGDTAGSLGGRAHAGAQTLNYTPPDKPLALLLAYGDALGLNDHARGGDDSVVVSSFQDATAYGDAQQIAGNARGGDDTVNAGAQSHGVASGDADVISGYGAGGNDQVTVTSVFGSAVAYGDARLLSDHARGGNDTVTGYGSLFHSTVTVFGDAETMSGYATGGNDTLNVPGSASTIYGDAKVLKDHARGGDDTLTGASSETFVTNTLYGDGEQLLGYAKGGNDVLISDHDLAPDLMWGDAAVVGPHATTGADRFVIMADSGHDQIMDFEPGKDHIDLSNLGLHRFNQVASLMQATSDGVLISFDAQDDLLVHGVGHLGARDFLFA